MNIITNQNYQNCPILGQPLVIAYIADKLEQKAKIDFKDLANHSQEEICTYARTLSAYMRSCTTINGKKFLQEKMRLLKREKYRSDWNIKYPVFANNWKTDSNKDLETLFSMKLFRVVDSINDKFPLILEPELVLEVIKQAFPEEMRKFKQGRFLSEPQRTNLKQITSALLRTCKAFYNCENLRNFQVALKKNHLTNQYGPEFVKIGNNIHNYPGGPGWLNDIFLTGWQYSYTGCDINKRTYFERRQWNETLEKDTIEIVKLFPESLLCFTLGTRIRDRVAPFSIACTNEHIPLPIIEFLLENGANPNLNDRDFPHECHWSGPTRGQTPKRFEEIVKMVKNHGFNFTNEIVVNYDPGFGKNLFIRGTKDIGLSWDKGIPLINLSANSWIHVIPDQDTFDYEYKILIDNIVWEKDVSESEQNHKGKSGEQISIVPNF